MPKGKPYPCRSCGKPREPERALRGIPVCYECGKLAHFVAVDQMKAKAGPVYERWKAASAAGIRRYLEAVLDSTP